jgi:hypothetical protein
MTSLQRASAFLSLHNRERRKAHNPFVFLVPLNTFFTNGSNTFTTVSASAGVAGSMSYSKLANSSFVPLETPKYVMDDVYTVSAENESRQLDLNYVIQRDEQAS